MSFALLYFGTFDILLVVIHKRVEVLLSNSWIDQSNLLYQTSYVQQPRKLQKRTMVRTQ